MKTGYQEIVRTLCPFTKENLNISKEKSTKIKKKTKKGIKITRKSVNLFGKFIVILLSDHIHWNR